jgi:hypothetical protein
VNGTQDQSFSSSSKVGAIFAAYIGCLTAAGAASQFFNGYADKFEFLPYCQHPNGTTYSVPVAAPSISAAGYASDWFDTQQWLMKSPSAASASAGANPTFTANNRLYVGEADTGAAAVSAVRPYAYQGRYDSGWINTLPAGGTQTLKSHNIGVEPKFTKLFGKCLTSEMGLTPGQVVEFYYSGASAPVLPFSFNVITKNQIGFTPWNSSSLAWGATNPSTGANGSISVLANWAYRVVAARGNYNA